ncbi:hypothetical protein [Blastopirellula retiformator]|uniref:Uncharacterized protein n=1 Tax=Blastopirellula retiformator TaxID=2527970 RepID=A0A5C5VNQ3_9BACT|nr:hypothetical protein [Blastopirellula retiformator]TWT39680.1 hypothetical protein Enr8_13810 [Blastopirellula retiformator]
MDDQSPVRDALKSGGPRAHQITLPRLFWSVFVVALLLGYIRLLAETAGASIFGVLLLASPAIGAAATLIWEPRTWLGAILAATPLAIYYFVLPLIMGEFGETPFTILLVGGWLVLLGCCGVRLYLMSFQSLLGEVLLVWVVFVSFCCGLPTMV